MSDESLLAAPIHSSKASVKTKAAALKRPGAKPKLVPGKAPAPVQSPKAGTSKAKAAPGSKIFMWKMISDSGAIIYFLGTIHVSRPDFYPLPDEMEKAFEKAQTLFVECVFSKSDKEKAKSLTEAKGLYPKGDDLSQHVSPLTLKALQKYCAGEDVSEDRYLKMKPWFASEMIEYYEISRGGYVQSYGIDNHFKNKADKLKKKVMGLETEEFHINVLAELNPELQDQMLKLTLLDLDKLRPSGGGGKLFKTWKEGDDNGMDTLLTKNAKEHPELQPVEDRILYDRNVTMADTIEPYLKGQGIFMVAVGSAHLVGDKSILELLKKKGYKCTQVLVGDQI